MITFTITDTNAIRSEYVTIVITSLTGEPPTVNADTLALLEARIFRCKKQDSY